MTPNIPEQAFRAELLAALGHAPDLIEPGHLQRFATSDRRGDDAGWCLMFQDRLGGVYGCYRAGIQGTWTARDRRTMTPSERAELARQVEAATRQRLALRRLRWDANARHNAQVWAQSVPLSPSDPCMLYLQRRGFGDVWPLPEVLRFHRALPYWHGAEKLGIFPAMVAPVIAPDGRMVALHRTYLTMDGHKADLPSPKKLTGTAGPLAGACIPLHEPVHGCIGIAEGIETALAAWCASAVPTVASYCAGNLAAWRWPAGVQRLVIFADADMAGREASDTLRARALAARLRVDVIAPTDPGSDWCDVWAGRDAALIESRGAT